MNTTMMVTLLGAACSDALESGQVVSGVGGQYNFVAMSHALPDARLLMMLRATHDNKDGLRSSIVWSYGHMTIPRHLRDVVVTEYGVADLRGQNDAEVIKRLIAIADSRFQDELVKQAKAHGKLQAGYQLPDRYRHNLPQMLEDKLHPWAEAGLLPDFPFGTDLTDDELHIVRALKKLKHASHHPGELVTMAVKSLWEGKEAPPPTSNGLAWPTRTASRTCSSAGCSPATSDAQRKTTGEVSPRRWAGGGTLRTQLRPASLAAYSAWSASWIKAASESWDTLSAATPPPTVVCTVRPFHSRLSCATRPRIRSAASSAPSGVGVRQEDRELFTAEASEQVGLAQRVAGGASNLAQQQVAGQVAMHVVDLLEQVDVDHQQCGRHVVPPAARPVRGRRAPETGAGCTRR